MACPPGPTIHVVDDDDAMRHSLSLLLATVGHSVVEHAGAATLLAKIERLAGCVVADLRMPHIDGLEMLERIRAAGSTVPVLIMTGQGDVASAVRAMKLGAWDFLEKPLVAPRLIDSVRSALVAAGANGAMAEPDPDFADRVARLTVRERAVFDLILLGHTNKEIGQLLKISHRTVEIHRAKVMIKTGCESIQALVRFAAHARML